MDVLRWADSLEREFYTWGNFNAYPRVPAPYIDVLDVVQGMTTPSNMHLLNLAVQCLEEGECYLEVGTWRGATLIGALLGNEAYGIGIDDDSMNNHDGDERLSRDVWHENVTKFGLAENAEYLDAHVPDVWESGFPVVPSAYRVGVYLFDGDKSTDEAAYAGLEGVLPFLSSQALIFLDDANDIHVRMASHQFCTAYPNNAVKILDLPTPGNCWPQFWNGVIAIGWSAA